MKKYHKLTAIIETNYDIPDRLPLILENIKIKNDNLKEGESVVVRTSFLTEVLQEETK